MGRGAAAPSSRTNGRRLGYVVIAALILLAALMATIVVPGRSFLCFSCGGGFPPRLPNHRLSLRIAIILGGAVLAQAIVLLGTVWGRALPFRRKTLVVAAALVAVAALMAAIAIPAGHFCPAWSCVYGASPSDTHLWVRLSIAVAGVAIAGLLLIAAAGPMKKHRALGAAGLMLALGFSCALLIPPAYSCVRGDVLGYVTSIGGPPQVGCGLQPQARPIQGSWAPGDTVLIDRHLPLEIGIVGFSAAMALALAVPRIRKESSAPGM